MSFGSLVNCVEDEAKVAVGLDVFEAFVKDESSGGLRGFEWRDFEVSGGGSKLYV